MRQNTDRRDFNVCVGSQKTAQGGNILCYVGGLAARGRSIGGSKNGAGWQGGLAAAVARRHLDVAKVVVGSTLRRDIFIRKVAISLGQNDRRFNICR